MQGDDSTTARARQLSDSCSRTITATRIQAGDDANAFRVETSAFPEPHAGGDAAAAVANFNVDDDDMRKTCALCMNDLIGDELGEALTVGQCVTLRQLMCTQLQPGMGALQLPVWAGGGHHISHAFHGACIERWFDHCMQQQRPACCPDCRFVFGKKAHTHEGAVESAADVTWQWDSQSVTQRLPPQLQQLLNSIERTSREENLYHIEKADAVTRLLHGLLVQLATDMDTSPGPLELLGHSANFFLSRLIERVNLHFANRPRIRRSRGRGYDWDSSTLESDDPVWGIKRCILRFVELLSANEYERRRNMDAFKVFLDHEGPENQLVTMFSPYSGRLFCFANLEDAFERLQHSFSRDGLWWNRDRHEVTTALKFIASYPIDRFEYEGYLRFDIEIATALFYGCLDDDLSVALAAQEARRHVPRDLRDEAQVVTRTEPVLLMRIAQILQFQLDPDYRDHVRWVRPIAQRAAALDALCLVIDACEEGYFREIFRVEDIERHPLAPTFDLPTLPALLLSCVDGDGPRKAMHCLGQALRRGLLKKKDLDSACQTLEVDLAKAGATDLIARLKALEF